MGHWLCKLVMRSSAGGLAVLCVRAREAHGAVEALETQLTAAYDRCLPRASREWTPIRPPALAICRRRA